jgi:hypothetical protein
MARTKSLSIESLASLGALRILRTRRSARNSPPGPRKQKSGQPPKTIGRLVVQMLPSIWRIKQIEPDQPIDSR